MDTHPTNKALVTVATVNQHYEAYMLKALLEEKEISVFLQDEIFAQLLSNASGGIKIQVSATDAEKAHEILNATPLS